MSIKTIASPNTFFFGFRHHFLKAIFFLVLVLSMTTAHAGLKFGDKDTIHHLATTTLKGPNGEQLYIGRLTTMKSFVLPYTIEDKGYVLGVVGDYQRYYNMPDSEFIDQAQAEGTLPNPLPPYEMDELDFALGHALWIFLAGMAIYIAYKQVFKKKPVYVYQEGGTEVVTEPIVAYTGPDIHLPARFLPSKSKYTGLLVISIIFVTIGIFMIRSGEMMGWLGAGFFGLGIPMSLLQMYSGKSYLEMDSEKFTFSTFLRSKSFLWKDVDMFYVWRMHNNKFVSWTPNSNYQGEKVNPVVSSLTGKGLMLPDTYGMKAEYLVDMMNEITRRQTVTGKFED